MSTQSNIVDAYLQRLSIDGSPEPGLPGPQLLHRAHVARVPYEDLGTCAGPRSDLPTLLDRITLQRRGGSATELNLAFAMLLVGLGFTVAPLHVTPPKEHAHSAMPRVALSVTIGADAYLADVSGSAADGPLDLGVADLQTDTAGRFEVLRDRRGQNAAVRGSDGLRYRISPTTHVLDAVASDAVTRLGLDRSARRHRTAPVVSLRRQRGRTTLLGTRLIETNGTARTDVELRREKLGSVMRDRFGVQLSPGEERCVCAAGPA